MQRRSLNLGLGSLGMALALSAGAMVGDQPVLRRVNHTGPGRRSHLNILAKANFNNSLLARRKTEAGGRYPSDNPNFRWGSTPHVSQEQRRANKLLVKATKAAAIQAANAQELAEAANRAQFEAHDKAQRFAANANRQRKAA